MYQLDHAPKWLNSLWNLEEKFYKAVCAISTVLFFGIISLIFVQVMGRYVLGISTAWAEELARYIWMPTVFIGCAYVTYMDKHIEINLNHLFIKGIKTEAGKEKVAKILYIYRFLMILLIGGYYSIMMVEYTAKVHQIGRVTPASHLPIWIFICGMTVGMILICVSCVSHILYGIYAKNLHKEYEDSEDNDEMDLGGTQ